MKFLSNDHLDAKHRPWPLPSSPWLMTQNWDNLLFAHMPIALENLRPLVPPSVEIDTYDGKAWLGMVPFGVSRIRVRGLPEMGFISHFTEINLRTYVTVGGKPGVLFLSMDADNPLAVGAARSTFRLPYTMADMSLSRTPRGFSFESKRLAGIGKGAEFKATYRPDGPVFRSSPGSLESWLTERYCYYCASGDKTYRCEIFHKPWPLQRAVATIEKNTLAESLGLCLDQTAPVLHYSHKITALIWMLRSIHVPE